MLLRFRVVNHRSIRDEAELSLVSTRLTAARPPDGDWASVTTRVAGVYGANASGKSTVLEALAFMVDAVRYSATRWGDRERFPYRPFALDDKSAGRRSLYELDVVFDGIRHTYGFESSVDGIGGEWLYSYPSGRRRVLFERHGLEGSEIEFGRSLQGENVRIARLLRPPMLYLSTAANSNHRYLRRLWTQLVSDFRYAEHTEMDMNARFMWARGLLEGGGRLAQAVALLRFADLGITDVVLDEEDIDEKIIAAVAHFLETFPLEDESARGSVNSEEVLAGLKKRIRFAHSSGVPGREFVLPLAHESSGTMAWLALGMPALSVLKNGGVLIVDELDSSLHPRLAAALVAMFKDSGFNPRGAQIIFTSHETSLMGSLVDGALEKDEVWFTEKGVDGATELFSLAEYPVRPTDNIERRYFQGRYGAVPVISLDELRSAIIKDEGE
ncbi:hypothetical protein SAMN05421505_11731 [Sinosporangium album]|uniref:ATPase AAA-type core domain-containing protein n=1 Tax=Sinosporangium album TaxID=504805 RepID=A0A1G8CZ54_9ACTN|nr:ATP-binding protein [Sinosporangium album]SDH50493.1 hypothetical protein SAMN05421505_11731 [Sinosporangium album]